MNEELLILVNTILSQYFNQEGLSPLEISLVEQFYPDAMPDICEALQICKFVLYNRELKSDNIVYSEAVLDKLAQNNSCTLTTVPDLVGKNKTQYKIMEVV